MRTIAVQDKTHSVTTADAEDSQFESCFNTVRDQIYAMIEKLSKNRNMTDEWRRELVAGLVGQLVRCARKEDKSILNEVAESLQRSDPECGLSKTPMIGMDAKQEARLRKALVTELKRPDAVPAPSGRPIVYQEESRTPERYTHWYVVWKQFDGLANEDRSRVILDAVEEYLGREAALKVTTAMGLLPDEPLARDLAEQAEAPASRKIQAVAEDRTHYGTRKRRS